MSANGKRIKRGGKIDKNTAGNQQNAQSNDRT